MDVVPIAVSTVRIGNDEPVGGLAIQSSESEVMSHRFRSNVRQ